MKLHDGDTAMGLRQGPLTTRFAGKTGGQIFHELLAEHQVDTVFGYPGGAVLPVFDAIYQSRVFRFILSRHEQGAGHMAEGYARLTGKPGIVLVTSGPGATNTVTPILDAWMDGTPLIVFAGQVALPAIGTDAFQEADMTGITRPCTKWNVMARKVQDLPRIINTAVHVATTGRPGPVFVDMPKDVTAAVMPHEPVREQVYLPGYQTHEAGTSNDIERAADMINRAAQPVFYVGQGVIQSGASDSLRQCAEKGNIPVTTTLQGLGAFDETDPKSLHMLGMHGSAYANWAMRDADVIIAIGARFDDRVIGDPASFAPGARAAERESRGGIIHFEIVSENIGKTIPVTLGIEGDARKNLDQLLPLLEYADRRTWFEQLARWKRDQPFRYSTDDRAKHLKPQAVIEELCRQTQGEAIITTGVGQHQMWAAQFYQFRTPRQWMTSGGAGTMGFGVPSSIGAQIGENNVAQQENRPARQVINIDGDGSFCMTAMEMVTAAQYGIAAKTIILNNNFLGMVKQWQDLFYQERYSHTEMHNPNFVALAEAMGCKGMRVDQAPDLSNVIEAFLAHPGPAILDAVVEKQEHIYPMMPAGKSVDHMVLDPMN